MSEITAKQADLIRNLWDKNDIEHDKALENYTKEQANKLIKKLMDGHEREQPKNELALIYEQLKRIGDILDSRLN